MKFLLFHWLSIILLYCNAKANTDSLLKIIAQNKNDSNHVKALNKLAEDCFEADPDKALHYMEKARDISETIQFENGMASAYGWLAYLNEQKGEISKALVYYRKSLSLFQQLDKKKDIATCLNNIAAIYKDRGMIDSALWYNRKSLELRHIVNDSAGLATTYNNIGLIYGSQGKIAESLEYYQKALRISEALGDVGTVSTVLENIGFIYRAQKQFEQALLYFRRGLEMNLNQKYKYGLGFSYNYIGGLYDEMNLKDSALFYHKLALKVRSEIDDKLGISYSLKNIGSIFQQKGLNDKALDHYQKSLKVFEELNDKWGTVMVTNKIGELMLSENKLNEAAVFLKRSLKGAQELGYPADVRNAAGNLQQLYRKQGDWKMALLMNDLFISMRDSIVNEENQKASIRTQFKYEYEKREVMLRKEQEKKDALANAMLKKQKLIRNAVTAGLIVVICFLIVFYRQRNKIASEKKRSDELLLNILPFEVAEELKLNGVAEARNFESVTIMFTDFKGFTQISEKLTARELVNRIDECFSAFDKIISNHRIEKIKTIGDAYMCAGGLPERNSTHAIDAVNAAMDICEFIDRFNTEKSLPDVPPFEIRIGIHTGPVVAGIVGIKKFSYDIWGDTVNTAARLEASGKPGRINVSETTYSLIKGQFQCEYRGEIEAKGKGPIKMYFVIGKK